MDEAFPFSPLACGSHAEPLQSPWRTHGQAKPQVSSFRIKNGPSRVSPKDVDVDSVAKPARGHEEHAGCPGAPAGATAPTRAESPAVG